jgi:hypothetical protein
VALLLGLLLFWVIRKRYTRSGAETNTDASEMDESGEPRRRKRTWL